MKINLKILMLIVGCICHTTYPKKIVTFENIPHTKLILNIKLTLKKNDQILGFISYAKMPVLNTYFLHTLYIFPEHRNKGNAEYLVRYVLQTLQKQKIDAVYIQPGPFELDYPPRPYSVPTALEKEEKLQQLIKLYEKCGFKKAHAPTKVANMLYNILNISEEDRQYLMVNKKEL